MRKQRLVFICGIALIPFLAAGCLVHGPQYAGNFERTLNVSGPANVELTNGSGRVVVRAGASNEVRIHGEVRMRVTLFGGSRERLDDVLKNPPIEQSGNTIRIGTDTDVLRFISIDYTISVPAETELRAANGSGPIEVRGLQGPLRAKTGSGGITATDIHEEATATTGSGSVHLENIGGAILATTGSGGIDMREIRGDVRASTGSGSIRLDDAAGRLSLHTGSGSIHVSGASGDLRAGTGSGRVSIDGNPAKNSYWELQSSSGGLDLHVPANASFRLYARAGSGRISTGIPLTIEEQSRHELRARAGDGAARVDLRCSSGSIRIE